MRRIPDRAHVVSVHYDGSKGVVRITLKWEGDYDIAAFDLGRLGRLVHCESETKNSGWALIEPYTHTNLGEFPLPFGPATLELSVFIQAGDTVPLKAKAPAISTSSIDLAGFFRRVKLCIKQKRLTAIAECFAQELARILRRVQNPPRLHRLAEPFCAAEPPL
jgi:hypothetical protein